MNLLHKALVELGREKELDIEEAALMVSRVEDVVDEIVVRHNLGTSARPWEV